MSPRPPAMASPGHVSPMNLISTPARLQQSAAPMSWKTERVWVAFTEDASELDCDVGAFVATAKRRRSFGIGSRRDRTPGMFAAVQKSTVALLAAVLLLVAIGI